MHGTMGFNAGSRHLARIPIQRGATITILRHMPSFMTHTAKLRGGPTFLKFMQVFHA
jgi:hypothetical protein